MHPEQNPLVAFLARIKESLFNPTRFFETLPLREGLSAPLAFGIACTWMGSMGSALWGQLGLTPQNDARSLWMQAQLPDLPSETWERIAVWSHWIFGMGSVAITPFLTLIHLLTASLCLLLGARVLHGSAPVRDGGPFDYETAVRILGYSGSAGLLVMIPGVGGLLSGIVGFILILRGVQVITRSPGGRAGVIASFALLPHLLLVLAALGVVVAVFISLFQL